MADESAAFTGTPPVKKKRTCIKDWQVAENHSVKDLAVKIVASKGRVVIFTGAGISRAAGLSTYYDDPTKLVSNETMQAAQPTLAHGVIADLVNRGVVSKMVTLNIDGLHRKSGLKPPQLLELHGSQYSTRCTACGKKTWHDNIVCPYTAAQLTKRTGRVLNMYNGEKCGECGGKMAWTSLPAGADYVGSDWDEAVTAFEGCELAIAVGVQFSYRTTAQIFNSAPKLVIVDPDIKRKCLRNLAMHHVDLAKIVMYMQMKSDDVFRDLQTMVSSGVAT